MNFEVSNLAVSHFGAPAEARESVDQRAKVSMKSNRHVPHPAMSVGPAALPLVGPVVIIWHHMAATNMQQGTSITGAHDNLLWHRGDVVGSSQGGSLATNEKRVQQVAPRS